MVDNNINEIIANALKIDKAMLSDNIKSIVPKIKTALNTNSDLIKQANTIDKNNSNGFIMDINIINNIINNIEKEAIYYGNVTLSQKDDDKKLIYGKQIMDIGNVIVVTDGNPYVTIEMSIRNILAGNTTIIVNNGYMYGSNKLIIETIQSVLEQANINKYLLQLFITEDYNTILSNFANIDLVICIGDHNLQTKVLSLSNNKTIISGYEHFDLYIEDTTNFDFLNRIMSTGLDINTYINKNTMIDNPTSILVESIDEAIAQINYNGSKYSAAIFTLSSTNASKFLREVKSKIVTVNTSPTIERIIDIKQSDLINEKTIIYPLNFKLDGKTTKSDEL